ncbi:MAG: MliC family protein [bacterium]
MKNKNLLISLFVIILSAIVAGYLLRRHVNAPVPKALNQNPSYTFMCPDQKSITATFHLPDDASVDVALSDGRTMNLPHAVSASGARYVNADESFVFWNKGTSAFIEENGKTTYDGCVTSAPNNQ